MKPMEDFLLEMKISSLFLKKIKIMMDEQTKSNPVNNSKNESNESIEKKKGKEMISLRLH